MHSIKQLEGILICTRYRARKLRLIAVGMRWINESKVVGARMVIFNFPWYYNGACLLPRRFGDALLRTLRLHYFLFDKKSRAYCTILALVVLPFY